VIVVDGLEAWGTFRQSLLDKLAEQGWVHDNDHWYPPPDGAAFEAAYAALCEALPVVPGMTRENMQSLMEGSYPTPTSDRAVRVLSRAAPG
jgi:hypothetical protein